jgi:muramoyltetrapeptide carboxypeptidase
MLKPRALERGDRIAVVAPASPFDRSDFDAGVAELKALGFEPQFEDDVFARNTYVAGSAATRAAAIRRAWNDPGIAALIAVRGGYGSVQTLPLLDRDEIRRTPKAVVGYSDITSLLTFLTLQCGLVSFHGPMLAGRLGRGTDGYDRQSFLDCLTRPEPIGEMAPDGLGVVRAGDASGMLIGGTLAQLVASLGTPYAFDPPPNHILFLEEVGERPYRLDRMVTQLRLAGLLARAAGIIVGELPRCDEPGGEPRARDVVARLLQDFPGPVVIGFPSGHTTGPAWTLPFGVRARLIANERPRVVIEESAVAPA